MKVIIVGVFFAILAGVLVEGTTNGNSTDASWERSESRGDTKLRNIHINFQPFERFINWMNEQKSVSDAGEQRTFARVRWLGRMMNLVMFFLGMLISMSAGGMMMGIWSINLGMGVMLLNMGVLFMRLFNNRQNGDSTTQTVPQLVMQGQGQTPFMFTIPQRTPNNFVTRSPFGSIQPSTLSLDNDRMEYIGNIVGLQPIQQNSGNLLTG
ncbi:hypothetical protein DMENIID0001_048180 [Sergentomyia squamirostris]